jgi:hypothetical protein
LKYGEVIYEMKEILKRDNIEKSSELAEGMACPLLPKTPSYQPAYAQERAFVVPMRCDRYFPF